MKKHRGWVLLLCLLLSVSAMTATECAADTAAPTGAQASGGKIDEKEVESRARALLSERLGCPQSMKLEGVYPDCSYSATYYTADARVGRDYEDMRTAYSVSFSYSTDENLKAYASAYFDKATHEPISLTYLHDSITPHYAESGFAPRANGDAITQEQMLAAIAEVEARLNLQGLSWNTTGDAKIFTNWGQCVYVRAQVAEGCVLSIMIGCDDGLEHGLELTYGTLTDVLPVYDRDDG